jgi:hypothetical protein
MVGASTVTVYGATTPLREGEIVWPEDDQYLYEGNCYIGGQSARAFDVAWQIVDLLTCGEFVDADAPSRCASVRFGNCVHVRLHRQHGRAFWRARGNL